MAEEVILTGPNGEKYVDATPTPSGFRMMKIALQESAWSYHKNLEAIEAIDTYKLGQKADAPSSFRYLTEAQRELVERGLEKVKAEIQSQLDKVQAGVDELERCGY